MKKVLSFVLAMVLVLTVLCSFSFAAEAPKEESDDVMGTSIMCPRCGGYATISTRTEVISTTVCDACGGVTIKHGYIDYAVCKECYKSTAVSDYYNTWTESTCNCK